MKTPLVHWPLQLSTTGQVVCAKCGSPLVEIGEVFTPADVRDRTNRHRKTCGQAPDVPRGNLVPRPPDRPNPGRP